MLTNITFRVIIKPIINSQGLGDVIMGHGRTDTHGWYTDVYLGARRYRHFGFKHHQKAVTQLELLGGNKMLLDQRRQVLERRELFREEIKEQYANGVIEAVTGVLVLVFFITCLIAAA